MCFIHLFVYLQIIANHQMPGISFASGGDPVSNVIFKSSIHVHSFIFNTY